MILTIRSAPSGNPSRGQLTGLSQDVAESAVTPHDIAYTQAV
jgi:hypothetical protein